MNILELPTYLATRRNHALEHATLKMLARKYDDKTLAGHSNPTGFFIFGEIPTDDIRNAIDEAMSRLRAGEHDLAIHPGCGTNLATSMVLPATFMFAPLQGARSRRGQLLLLPLALLLGVFGFLLSKPLGPWLQRNVTTEANLGTMQVIDVKHVRKGVHRITTKN
jgi:hypothetical protein